MNTLYKRFDNLKEIYDKITDEINVKQSYTLYYLFIFWISVAVFLLLLQDVFDYIRHKHITPDYRFKSGIIQKLAEKFYVILKRGVLTLFDHSNN